MMMDDEDAYQLRTISRADFVIGDRGGRHYNELFIFHCFVVVVVVLFC